MVGVVYIDTVAHGDVCKELLTELKKCKRHKLLGVTRVVDCNYGNCSGRWSVVISPLCIILQLCIRLLWACLYFASDHVSYLRAHAKQVPQPYLDCSDFNSWSYLMSYVCDADADAGAGTAE